MAEAAAGLSDHVDHVLRSLEDDLASIGVQHAQLLSRAHQQRDQACNGMDAVDREATAHGQTGCRALCSAGGADQHLRCYAVHCE